MSNSPWFAATTVYQVYPRSFADSNDDGIGDLGGIISRVDHFASLGVGVVWLSPIYRSPQVDNGYDISDYEEIDPLFGDLSLLDELIAALHARGIRLVMDLVVNHTSDQHPWFIESRSSRDNPKRDWYHWLDPRDGQEPNNWGSVFSGSAWTLDEPTHQYYLHLFAQQQPDLNWENPEVRAAIYAMMNRWLDRGVDGFRMDVINLIAKPLEMLDVAPRPGKRFVVPTSTFANSPRVHEFLQEMRREVFAERKRELLTVGETPGARPSDAVLYTDPARGEVDMIFQFEHVELDIEGGKFAWIGFDLLKLKKSMNRWQAAVAERGWNSLYWNNHDQARVVSRFADDDPQWWARSAKAFATILHGMRGTPFVYQGEEIGMTNFALHSPDQLRDVEALNYWREVVANAGDEAGALAAIGRLGRDNARTPMQWDGSVTGGFTAGAPWIDTNPNVRWLNVESQESDPSSVLSHYKALIRLRREVPVIADGDFEALFEDDRTIWSYTRSTQDSRLLVIANCSREPRRVLLPEGWIGARLLLGNDATARQLVEADEVELAGWDARIYLADRS